jgi:hypothetical protein
MADALANAFSGLFASRRGLGQLQHSVVGVSEGFSRSLQLVGVGYSVTLFNLAGKEVKSLSPGAGGRCVLGLGYSHSLTWWLLPTGDMSKYMEAKAAYGSAGVGGMGIGKASMTAGEESLEYLGDSSCGIRLLPLSRATSKLGKGGPGGPGGQGGQGGKSGKPGKGSGVGEVVPTRKFVVFGYEKEKVHQFAAKLRHCRAPSVYKGRGVSVVGEVLHLKAGKTK